MYVPGDSNKLQEDQRKFMSLNATPMYMFRSVLTPRYPSSRYNYATEVDYAKAI